MEQDGVRRFEEAKKMKREEIQSNRYSQFREEF
jgi:hypothetical protein